eukprot:scaffold71677_cov36-Tisochrysis_lutea.AAC.2
MHVYTSMRVVRENTSCVRSRRMLAKDPRPDMHARILPHVLEPLGASVCTSSRSPAGATSKARVRVAQPHNASSPLASAHGRQEAPRVQHGAGS